QPTDPILREHRPHRCPTSADDPRLRDERQVITHPAWCAAAPTRRASARLQNGKISNADRAGGFIRGYRRWQRRILGGPRLSVVRRNMTVPAHRTLALWQAFHFDFLGLLMGPNAAVRAVENCARLSCLVIAGLCESPLRLQNRLRLHFMRRQPPRAA